MPSADGSVIVFESDCDLTGGNEDQVNEVFAIVADTLVQVTSAPEDICLSTMVRLARSGDFVVFESDCDFVGRNSDASVEVFRSTLAGEIEQISDFSGPDTCESTLPTISDDGGFVVFASFCDVTGDNADQSIELYGWKGNIVSQLTSSTDCSHVFPRLRGASAALSWVSDCNLTGLNDDGSWELLSERVCTCGAPSTRFATRAAPTAADALAILRSSVGSGHCALCDCDVNGDTKVTASDALTVLKKAVDQDVTLACP